MLETLGLQTTVDILKAKAKAAAKKSVKLAFKAKDKVIKKIKQKNKKARDPDKIRFGMRYGAYY